LCAAVETRFTALEALLSAADSDVGHCLLATAEGHLPASLGRAKHDHLIAGGEDILCSQLYVLPCSYIKKLHEKVYEKINKKYEWIFHIIFYQPTKF
jgi:hypothetical protein